MYKNLFWQFHVTCSPYPRHSSNNWQWPHWPNAQQHRSRELGRPERGGRLLLSMTSQHGTKTAKPLGPSAHLWVRAMYDTNCKHDGEPSSTGKSERITFCLWGQRERNWRKNHQGRGGAGELVQRIGYLLHRCEDWLAFRALASTEKAGGCGILPAVHARVEAETGHPLGELAS